MWVGEKAGEGGRGARLGREQSHQPPPPSGPLSLTPHPLLTIGGKVTTEGYSLIIKVEEKGKGFSSMQPSLITQISCAMKPRAGCSFIQQILSLSSVPGTGIECWDYVMYKTGRLSLWPLRSNGKNQVTHM